ncbi:MAG: CotH kinase family protein [Lewinella sp.]
MKAPLLLLSLLLSFFGNAQTDFSSQLPLLRIETGGAKIVDEPKIMARLSIIDHADGRGNRPEDTPDGYDGFIGIELRGSSSQQRFPKKGFGLETWDEMGEDVDVGMLGMPSEEDWVLHGPYSDKSLIRNALTYRLAEQMMDYAPRSRLVELFVDGEYRGVYLFTEKIKRDEARVDISRLREEDNSGDQLTGGYLLKFDKFNGNKEEENRSFWFPSVYGSAINSAKSEEVSIQYDYPAPEDITDPQRSYIQRFIREFEERLAGEDFTDPSRGYRPLVDLPSFVDFMLVNELTRNVDGYRLSTWMYKTKDSKGGKLHMGPVWDFNLAFGNANYCNGSRTDGWAYDFNWVCPESSPLLPFWWERMRQDPVFLGMVQDRWRELRNGLLHDDHLDRMVDSLVSEMGGAVDRNFERWPVIGTHVWPNDFVGSSYAEELTHLRGWMHERTAWLDGAIPKLEVPTALNGPLLLSPNPARGSFRMLVDGEVWTEKSRLYDSLGRLVLEGTPGQTEFDVRGLPTGLYFFSVIANATELSAKVFIR